jgi:predicted nucleotidyltransferase
VKKTVKRSVPKVERSEIVKTITSVLGQHAEINTAYLFGSFLKGDFFADIDLGLLLGHPPPDLLEYEFEIEIELEKQVNVAIDVRVLNHAPVSFVQNVLRHGKVILDRVPNIRSDFESYCLRKYFDFALFRERYLSEVIYAPI